LILVGKLITVVITLLLYTVYSGKSVHSDSFRGRSLFKPKVTETEQVALVSACLEFAPDSVLSKVWPGSSGTTEAAPVAYTSELPSSVLDMCKDVGSVSELMTKLHPIQPETVGFIERETVGQNSNPKWHTQRLGRITASHFHDVFTKIESVKKFGHEQVNVKPLLNVLLGLHTVPDSLPALKHGREMEPKAKARLVSMLTDLGHANVKLQDCGLYVVSEKPFLAASPDAIVECDCCGMSIVEIKSPMPRTGTPDYLLKQDEKWQLKTGHRHRTQMLGQMAATHIHRGYFFVYMAEPVLVKVAFDGNRWAAVSANLEDFFIKVMAPALLQLQHKRDAQ